MLDGLLSGLIIAWMLTWFNFDRILINGLQDLFKLNITKDVYYLGFAVLGALSGLLKR